MCLSTIEYNNWLTIPFRYRKKENFGYKVYEQTKAGLFSVIYSTDGSHNREPVVINKEYTATDTKIKMGLGLNGRLYKSGFHIYEKIEDAKKMKYYLGYPERVGRPRYAVVKVQYSKPVCVGKNEYDDKGFTVIAKKMKIIEIL